MYKCTQYFFEESLDHQNNNELPLYTVPAQVINVNIKTNNILESVDLLDLFDVLSHSGSARFTVLKTEKNLPYLLCFV